MPYHTILPMPYHIKYLIANANAMPYCQYQCHTILPYHTILPAMPYHIKYLIANAIPYHIASNAIPGPSAATAASRLSGTRRSSRPARPTCRSPGAAPPPSPRDTAIHTHTRTHTHTHAHTHTRAHTHTHTHTHTYSRWHTYRGPSKLCHIQGQHFCSVSVSVSVFCVALCPFLSEHNQATLNKSMWLVGWLANEPPTHPRTPTHTHTCTSTDPPTYNRPPTHPHTHTPTHSPNHPHTHLLLRVALLVQILLSCLEFESCHGKARHMTRHMTRHAMACRTPHAARRTPRFWFRLWR